MISQQVGKHLKQIETTMRRDRESHRDSLKSKGVYDLLLRYELLLSTISPVPAPAKKKDKRFQISLSTVVCTDKYIKDERSYTFVVSFTTKTQILKKLRCLRMPQLTERSKPAK